LKVAGTTTTGVSIAIDSNRTWFRCPSAVLSSVSVGKLVKVRGPSWSGTSTYYYGWFGKVTRVSADSVFLDVKSIEKYTATQITVINPYQNVRLSGLHFNMNFSYFSNMDGLYILDIRGAKNVSVRNSVFRGTPNTDLGPGCAVRMEDVDSVDISDNNFRDIKPNRNITKMYVTNTGGHDIFIHHNTLFRTMVGFESGSSDYTSWIKMQHNWAYGDSAQQLYASHGNTVLEVAENYANGEGPSNIQLRNQYSSVHDNYSVKRNSSQCHHLACSDA
jgi:hypothetical protein